MEYQKLNAEIISKWCREGWQWGQPITHEEYVQAKEGQWDVLLTPTKFVPKNWFGPLAGKKILGLASGGGQQMPIFAALGAQCTLLDYSQEQCSSDRMVAQREGYSIEIIQADMTKPLPFPDETFDMIFHPVSNCYVETVEGIFKECYRILKQGGIFLGGYDLGINYLFDEDENELKTENQVAHPLIRSPLTVKKELCYSTPYHSTLCLSCSLRYTPYFSATAVR